MAKFVSKNLFNSPLAGNAKSPSLIAGSDFGHFEAQPWQSDVISYGFAASRNAFRTGYGVGELAGAFSVLSADQRTAIRKITDYFDSILGIDLIESAQADIVIAQSNTVPTAHAYSPGTSQQSGDIWLNPAMFKNIFAGDMRISPYARIWACSRTGSPA